MTMKFCWKFYESIKLQVLLGLLLSFSALNGVKSDCKCGWKKITRIVGGEETGVNEYPMMCGLVNVQNKEIYCGCIIIAKQYVLTAAHCVENKAINEIGIIVGEHNVITGKETNATKLFRLDSYKIHPQYNSNRLFNDVAVCKIIGMIEFNSEVGPVCLPFQHKQDSFANKIVTALGWGLLDFGGEKSNTLQKVNLNVITLDNCKKYYSNINGTNICTLTPKKDTCQMDSGGPLLWQNPTTRNLVSVGIISAGYGCASGVPAIAMRTGAFIDWIQLNTPGARYCTGLNNKGYCNRRLNHSCATIRTLRFEMI